MKASAKALSGPGKALSSELGAIVRQYETRLGPVPPWMLARLSPIEVAALLEIAVRIGIPYCVKDLDLMAQSGG